MKTESEKMLVDIFRQRHVCSHITALKAFDNFIIVAESNQISLFDWRQKLLLEKEIVFQSCSIHGIRKDKNLVVFFGAKSFRIYQFNSTSTKRLNKISEEFGLDDWIHDIQFLDQKQTTLNTLAVVCAHNSVNIWDVKLEQTKQFQCVENCILYSASIICRETNVLVIASGTVFNKILLWSPDCTEEKNNKKVPFHTLIGHQGVIFSITYNAANRLLSSTSDDRSVRLWKVWNDTSTPVSLEFWKKANIEIAHVLFAHESRVWMSCILKDHVLSVGEDSQLCFWDLNGNLLRKRKCHKNGSIWCLETVQVPNFNGEDSYECVAFTGGSDGGVCMWDIAGACFSEITTQISLQTKESTVSDFPRITFLTEALPDSLMVTTDKGNLSLYNMVHKTWNHIFYDSSFSSYCVPSISKNSALLAMGNILGDLVIINLKTAEQKETGSVDLMKAHENKICSIHWVCQTNDYLLTCGIKGHMAFWKVGHDEEKFYLQCLHKLFLPKCKNHWWSTAALYISNNCIVVGDRGGSVSLYNSIHDTSLQLGDIQVSPSMTYRYIHGENGVSDIQEHNSLIYSSGRDGKVQLYFMSEDGLNLLHSIKVSHDLEWIGKMLFFEDDLLLLGFHTKDFIVWSTRLESAVMTVECGGGHRSWDLYLDEKGQAVFAAIKKKDIIFCKENLRHILTRSVLKVGISGQEFRCCSYLFTKHYSSQNSMSLVACGGEDTSLRIIGLLNRKQPGILPICSLSGHLSSIMAIGKLKISDSNSFLLASVGGRSQMVVWKINCDSSVQCQQLGSFILSSFNRPHHQRDGQDTQIDPQTRLMDVAISYPQSNDSSSGKYIIAVACSDTHFRIYTYDIQKMELSLCYNMQHGTHCTLKLSQIFTEDSSIFFVTGATDGYIKFICSNLWDTDVLKVVETSDQSSHSDVPELQLKLHHSGVNALDIKHVSDDIWLVCTGGDDNALSVSLISCLKGNTVKKIDKHHVLNAHASQITGVKILDENAIVSTSVDQRINVWKWSFDGNRLTVELVFSRMSVIPDIANLVSWKDKATRQWTLLVCGQGLESFELSFNKSNELD